MLGFELLVAHCHLFVSRRPVEGVVGRWVKSPRTDEIIPLLSCPESRSKSAGLGAQVGLPRCVVYTKLPSLMSW